MIRGITVSRRRKNFPEVGELVIGTVKKIFEHGAYVALDEYGGLEAYAPINEIVTSWFHSIKDYLKEGQKAVFKVVRVDRRKGLVDVSLKRVTPSERKSKLFMWKRLQKATRLLNLVAQRLGRKPEEILDIVEDKAVSNFGDLLAVFEVAAKEGIEPLKAASLPQEIAEKIVEVARQYIPVPEVKVSGVLKVLCMKPGGLYEVRETLLKAYEVAKQYGNVKVRVYTVGVPRYRVDVIARDYKVAEKVLEDIVNVVMEEGKRRQCEVSFTRL
ncbi:MAG: translation initiation factor 2 [Thermoprotei archaeon]|nr:MAG: translation initiation factor 2 [Thermoprotei archaeon]